MVVVVVIENEKHSREKKNNKLCKNIKLTRISRRINRDILTHRCVRNGQYIHEETNTHAHTQRKKERENCKTSKCKSINLT